VIDLINRAIPSSDPQPDPEEAALEDQIAARAAEAGLQYFQWNIKSLITTVTEGTETEIPYETLELLAERRDAYVSTLVQVLQKRKAGEEVCMITAGCLLDLYTVSNVLGTITAKPGMSDDYTALIMDFEPSYEEKVMKVFFALEKEVAKLTGKKLETPVVDDPEDVNAEPIDDEPMSDADDDSVDDNDLDDQASQQQREARLLKPLVAQMSLCQYTSKLVLAISAGVIRDKAARKRLERNKAKLGPNFKEVVAFLDVPGAHQRLLKSNKGRAKPKAAPNGDATAKKSRPAPKSNAIVAEDELDDEIEDEPAADEEAEREQALEQEEQGEPDEEEEPADEADDDESVIGD
jgi:cohesin complex subunit SA-1/2